MPRILSVEDDPDFQHLISYALRNQGFEAHYAFTGKEGVEKALSLNPDLILLDMLLPGMNGVEVIKELKKSKATRETPIIILTAFPQEVHFFESEVKALGVVEYLRKPVQMEELVAACKRLVRGARPKAPFPVWKRGDVRIIPDTKSVMVGGRMIANLAPKRFEVLYHLMQASAEVPWEELVEKVWGREGTKNDLEKTVSRLREDLGSEAYRLGTTRRGYRFEA